MAVSAQRTTTVRSATKVIRYDSLRILEREADYEKWRRVSGADCWTGDSQCWQDDQAYQKYLPGIEYGGKKTRAGDNGAEGCQNRKEVQGVKEWYQMR